MKKSEYLRFNFFFDFFLKNKTFPSFYAKITETFSGERFDDQQIRKTIGIANKVISIYDIPGYLKVEPKHENESTVLEIPLYSGYLINLSGYSDFQNYMQAKFKKVRRSQLRRLTKRLDLCLRPTYKVYYGAIEKAEYDHLFKTLLVMTERRFIQKKERNFEMPFLKMYRKIMYPLILEKRASIFVIYDRDKPINISLNFIDKNIVFHWNSCFDIDYSVFSIGRINIVNHLQWSYKNGFKLFDMGRGDFFHKRKWVDNTYTYKEQLVFDSKSFYAVVSAYSRFLLLKLRYYVILIMKALKLHLWYGKFITYRYGSSREFKDKLSKQEITIVRDDFEFPPIDQLKKVKFDQIKSSLLICSINNFIHKNQIYIQNLSVFSEIENHNTFYLKWNKEVQKLIISSIEETS